MKLKTNIKKNFDSKQLVLNNYKLTYQCQNNKIKINKIYYYQQNNNITEKQNKLKNRKLK